MERQRFRELRAALREAARGHNQDARCTHPDATIILTALWAALHNKPISWATAAKIWYGNLQPKPLPSQSCMSRRLRSFGVLELIEKFNAHLRTRLPDTQIKMVDGRPLTTGGCSKDTDAATGYGAGHKVRGYKLHMICDRRGAVDAWVITPMNGSEPEAASLMLEHTRGGAYILGDGNYDVNHLYEKAALCQTQWIALPRRRHAKAMGHREHSPHRKAVWPWVRSASGGRLVRRLRSVIERINGWQGCTEVGLGALPHHVRRRHRVQVWVGLKLAIYHHWLAKRIARSKAA